MGPNVPSPVWFGISLSNNGSRLWAWLKFSVQVLGPLAPLKLQSLPTSGTTHTEPEAQDGADH